MNYFVYQTPIGPLTICEEQEKIVVISTHRPLQAGTERETEVIRQAHTQLSEYFEGRRKTFDLPLTPKGTPFQQRVWQALCDIPYGETRSYKQVAQAVGNAKGARAVGMANNRNPLMIVVPCHRVTGSDGQMVGYAAGIEKKEYLLRLEGSLL